MGIEQRITMFGTKQASLEICDLLNKENTVLIMSLNSLTSNMQAKESQYYF